MIIGRGASVYLLCTSYEDKFNFRIHHDHFVISIAGARTEEKSSVALSILSPEGVCVRIG
jgi:hypothetical protein